MSIFSDISEYVWDLLISSKEYKIHLGEETISDMILLKIAEKKYSYVTINKTPKNKESKTGTDWELWVGNIKSGWYRYAIQAKKMNSDQCSYKNLKHKVGSRDDYKYQHIILAEYAKTTKSIALYAFYNYPREPLDNKHWHCTKPISQKKIGVTIANLGVITKIINQRGGKNFHSIHEINTTYPLHCLLECVGTIEQLRIVRKTTSFSSNTMELSSSNILSSDFKKITSPGINNQPISGDKILKGFNISEIFSNDDFRNKYKDIIYPNNSVLPKRILVIDTEKMNNSSVSV